MSNVMSAIQNTISISLFNRGMAGRIFEEVKKCGAKVVMKNNIPECVLLSPEEYTKLIDEVNDAKLLKLATERMKKYDSKSLISQEEIDKKFGFVAEDLEDYDKVNLE